jgi:hypothetical protein
MSNSALPVRQPKPQAQPNLLPVVRRVIEQLDQLFLRHFGLLGKSLVDDVFAQWLRSGKTGPSGLRHYVYALSMQLDGSDKRNEFVEHADRLLLNLQSGYVS